MTTASASNVPWSRYVAVGDSFTEGLWDPYVPPEPGARVAEDAALRGWADRMADTLSRRRIAAGEDPLLYANLAIRGRPLRKILAEQLSPALAMKPDLISIVGGGIDVLRLGANPDGLAGMLEDAVMKARATGADVLLATCMDTSKGGPLLAAIRPRMALYSAQIFSMARRHGCYVLDQWGLKALRDLRMWSPDRIHHATAGHHRLSQAALVALGLEPDDPQWRVPLPKIEAAPATEQVRDFGVWLRQDVAPWAGRGIRRQSTGDARRPKRPDLAAVVPDRLSLSAEQ